MFRKLALLISRPPWPPPAEAALEATKRVFSMHPAQLASYLEEAWEGRSTGFGGLTPAGLEIPESVPQLALERDAGIRDSIPHWLWIAGKPTGGTFTLELEGEDETKRVPFNAGAEAVREALGGLELETTEVEVAGGPLPDRPISIRFLGVLAFANVKLSADSTDLESDDWVEARVESRRGDYPPVLWNHLIYAYMVENTRLYEIFRRVLEEYAYGERLGAPSEESQRWLRTTEQLFYNDPRPLQAYSTSSWIRPDIRAVRRNAYQRMFGLDLNHGTDDNRPYPYPRATAANTDFTGKFEELLREVWRAIENARNQIGPNQTDVSTIANLARAIYDMLRVRRQEGNLARDELCHVSTMSWFHLTLSFDTPIVCDLKAQATSAAERLQKIGERVGLPAHSRSDSYFRLATQMSLLLRELELGTFNESAAAPALFQPGTAAQPNRFGEAIQEIITHWTITTGRDLKSARVSVAPTAPKPVRPAPRPILSAPAGNGRVGVSGETLGV